MRLLTRPRVKGSVVPAGSRPRSSEVRIAGHSAGSLPTTRWARRKFTRSLAIERTDLGGAQCTSVDSNVIDFSLHQIVLLGASADHPIRVDV